MPLILFGFIFTCLYVIRGIAAQYYNAAYYAGFYVPEFGECYYVVNTCSTNTMFVPTNTAAEWNSVKASAPACLNRTPQAYETCYGMGMGMGGADGGDGGD